MATVPTLLTILAVVRLTRLVVVDEIPFGPWRRAIQIRGNKEKHRQTVRVLVHMAGERPRVSEESWPARTAMLVVCPWCVSVWIAAGYVAARWAWPGVMGWVSLGLSASWVAGWLGARVGE